MMNNKVISHQRIMMTQATTVQRSIKYHSKEGIYIQETFLWP